MRKKLKNCHKIYYSYNVFKIIKSILIKKNLIKNIDKHIKHYLDLNKICIKFKKYNYKFKKCIKFLLFLKNENCWLQNLNHKVTKLENLFVKINSKNMNINYFIITPGLSFAK